MSSADPTSGAPGRTPVPGASEARIRPATRADVPEILAMVHELAEYERSSHEVQATEALIEALLFGDNTPHGQPGAFCHVVEAPEGTASDAGDLAGFALWFLNTSTWLGRHGIYLEDLYVRPEHRGRGFGRDLMAVLAQICLEREYGRLEWWVLDWNTPAIDFYRALGATGMDEWTVHRLADRDLGALAAHAPTTPAPRHAARTHSRRPSGASMG